MLLNDESYTVLLTSTTWGWAYNAFWAVLWDIASDNYSSQLVHHPSGIVPRMKCAGLWYFKC